jgi:hypothetical protein
MEPTELLARQHRQIDALFRKLERACDAQEQRRHAGELEQRLARHLRIEEEIFYPALCGLADPRAGQAVLELGEAHRTLRLVAAELVMLDPRSVRFLVKATMLEELIEHHVETEEAEVFRLAAKLARPQRQALVAAMRTMAGDVIEAAEVDDPADAIARRRG